jgi:diguanylate cyclase (GGDEF)-like protein
MHQAAEHSNPVIAPPGEKRHQEPERQSPGWGSLIGIAPPIKLIAYISATIVVAMFLTITVTNLWLAKAYYQSPDDNGISQRLADKAQIIAAQLTFYQQIVDHVAKQPTTQDILEYRNETSAQTWALQMRRFLPQALGVAVMTREGRVLGEPAVQELCPQCLTDLARLSQNEKTPTPPVHRDAAGLAHFDLVAPVLDEAENPMGMLFVSFRLDSLQPLVREATNGGQRLVLNDGQGQPIAEYNRISDPAKTRERQFAINNSNWTLSLTENASGSLPSFLSLAIFNVSAFLLTVGIIAFLVRYAMRSLSSDFAQIKALLNKLAEGAKVDDETPTPQLRETAEILPAITHIRRDIDKKQQLLEHTQLSDDLTGLPNRRQFNLDFIRAYDFARRSTPVCVTLLRLQDLERLDNSQADLAIKVLAKTLKGHARKIDPIARIDEDHFALLMFGMTADGATPSLQRLYDAYQERQKQHPGIPDKLMCKLYCGYTLIHPHRDNSASEVYRRAEVALLEAQKSDNQHIISA